MSETTEQPQEITEPVVEAPVKQKRQRKRPVGFYIAGSWLGLIVFLGLFGFLLPVPRFDESFTTTSARPPAPLATCSAPHRTGTTCSPDS